MYRIPGSQTKLPLLSCHSFRGEVIISYTVPLPVPAGKGRSIQTMPMSARHHGFSNFCCTSGASNDEGFSALGSSIAPVPTSSPQPHNAGVCGGAPPLEGHDGSRVGRPTEGGVIQGHHDNGRVPVRVGSNLVGQSCELHMGPEGGSCSQTLWSFGLCSLQCNTFCSFSKGAMS